jgi:hypothetical protein
MSPGKPLGKRRNHPLQHDDLEEQSSHPALMLLVLGRRRGQQPAVCSRGKNLAEIKATPEGLERGGRQRTSTRLCYYANHVPLPSARD